MALGSGILLGSSFDWPAIYWFFTVIAIGLWVMLNPFLPPLFRQIGLLAAVIFLGGGLHQLFFTTLPADHIKNLLSKEVVRIGTLEGTVIEIPEEAEQGVYLTVRTEKWWEKGIETRVFGKVRLRIFQENIFPQPGDRIRVTGRLSFPSTASNPGEFDYREYLARQKIFAVLYPFTVKEGKITNGEDEPTNIKIVGQAKINPLTVATAKVRRRLGEVIERTLPPVAASLLSGILIGERRKLPETVEEMFQDTGVIHIVAISGLQVGLIALSGFLILRFFRIPKKVTSGVNMGLVIFYAWMVGRQPSVVRSAVMSVAVLSSSLLDRDPEPFSVLMLAGFLIMLVNPGALFEAGFQLSFAATAGLIYLSPRLKEFLPSFPHWLQNLMGTTFGAQLAVLPLTARHFGRISLVSPVANLLIVPLASFITVVGFVAGLAGMIYFPMAKLFNAANWLAITALLKTVGFFSQPGWSSYWMKPLGGGGVILYYLAIFLILKKPFRKPLLNKISCAGALLLILIIFCCPFPKDFLECTFLSVGQGDAIFLSSPAGINFLVDAGGEPGRGAGERIIMPFLRYRGVRRIDYVMISHFHDDHIEGLATVIENFPVSSVFYNGQQPPSAKYQNLVNLLNNKSIPHRSLLRGEKLIFRDLKIDVLHPPKEFIPRDPNNLSLVLKLTYKNISILFTGDAEKPAIKALLGKEEKLSSNIVKIPHHGSEISFTSQFLKAVQPQIAIISSGRKAGFPAETVVKNYRENNCWVYRTDNQGAITLRIDGSHYWINTFFPRHQGFRKIWEGLKIWRE